MRISFSPQRSDERLEVHKAGDVLTINGEAFDFSSLPEGAVIVGGRVPTKWVDRYSPIKREGGQLHLTLVLPHGPNPSDAVAEPADLINPPDGKLTIPVDAPEPPILEEAGSPVADDEGASNVES